MRHIRTKDRALKEGRSLLQKHGYNGFSFQDIADKLDIKKPSLYDHFSSKEDLIVAIIQDYGVMFDTWTHTTSNLSPIARVRKVFDIFYAFISDKQKICPILALSTDIQALSKDIQNEMSVFVGKWLAWLERQIKEGQDSGEIRRDMDAKILSTFIYSQAMGSQVQARIKKEPEIASNSGDMIVALIRKTV